MIAAQVTPLIRLARLRECFCWKLSINNIGVYVSHSSMLSSMNIFKLSTKDKYGLFLEIKTKLFFDTQSFIKNDKFRNKDGMVNP